MQILIGVIVGISISYIGFALYAKFFAESLIFPAPPVGYQREAVDIWLDGEIPAMWLPVADADWTILFLHGNAEDIGDVRPMCALMQAQGYQVFIVEYPGYGLAPGKPSEAGCFRAAQLAYAHLTTELGIEPSNLLVYGRSLGSGPATWLATQSPIAGLILDGAFTSTFRTVSQYQILWWDIFDNLARIPEVSAPVLSLHGWRDRTCPISHAKKLYQAVEGPKQRLWNFNAGHNNFIEVTGATYWDALREFTELCRNEQKRLHPDS